MNKWLLIFLVVAVKAYDDDEKFLYCYYSSDFSGPYVRDQSRIHPKDVDPYLCTHIGYMSFKAVGKGEDLLIEEEDPKKGGMFNEGEVFEEILEMKRLNRNLRILAVFPSWIPSSLQIPVIAATPGMRKKFASAALDFIKDAHLDGIDISWNFPNMNNSNRAERQDFVELLKELWTQLQPKGYTVAAYITSKPVSVNNSYVIDEISKYVHFLNVAAFHYNGIYGRQTGINSPMYSNDFLNIHFTYDNLLFRGAPASKILIGLPTFGHQFLMNQRTQGVDSLGVPSNETFPSRFTGSKNIVGYNEICSYLKRRTNDWKQHWDSLSLTPYIVDKRKFISFDNPESFQEKVRFANLKGFKGVMIWHLGLDDFKGNCHGETFPLTRSVHKLMNFGVFEYDVKIVNEIM